ncbi:hypothetical protein SAMN05216264_101604 [Pseudomonas marincola]|nr:hypothetical protein SAMN05216264_101604 [Pseudomonas marincola]
MMDALEAAGIQPKDSVAQPKMESLTATERLLLRFYRELQQQDQQVIRQAVEALATGRGCC